jgi:CBS domain containing-hemolysin-like protein
VHSPAELLILAKESAEAGKLGEHESDLVERAFEMSDVLIREVMVPRKDIISIGEKATLAEIVALINKCKHHKFPVFDESRDNVVGILNTTDLFTVLAEHGTVHDAPFNVPEHMRQPYFVLDTLKVSSVMQDMRAQHIKMCIIVDEYGTVIGLATLEDLVEELVGEIEDEYDSPTEEIHECRESTFRVKGLVTLADFNNAFACELASADSSTVAGAFIEALGRQPETGESLLLHGFHFTVVEKEEQAITWFEVKRV